MAKYSVNLTVSVTFSVDENEDLSAVLANDALCSEDLSGHLRTVRSDYHGGRNIQASLTGWETENADVYDDETGETILSN